MIGEPFFTIVFFYALLERKGDLSDESVLSKGNRLPNRQSHMRNANKGYLIFFPYQHPFPFLNHSGSVQQ